MGCNWIKHDVSLASKPRVHRIAADLGMDRFSVVGRLCAVWCWADSMSEDGRIPFATLEQLDAIADCSGFGRAMQKVEWLEVDGHDLIIPEWEKHHGTSAKARAQTNRRVTKHREHAKQAQQEKERNATGAPPRNADGVTRGEEKREEERRRNRTSTTRGDDSPTTSEPMEDIPGEGGASAVDPLLAAKRLLETERWENQQFRDQREIARLLTEIANGEHLALTGDTGKDDPIGWLRPRVRAWISARGAERDAGRGDFLGRARNWVGKGHWTDSPEAVKPYLDEIPTDDDAAELLRNS